MLSYVRALAPLNKLFYLINSNSNASRSFDFVSSPCTPPIGSGPFSLLFSPSVISRHRRTRLPMTSHQWRGVRMSYPALEYLAVFYQLSSKHPPPVYR